MTWQGGARVSGVRGGALRRGHRRLPIAHNETALSAGSGAEGKHGEGAQPGQKEAEDRGGGGECFEPLLPVSLRDSPPGWVSGGIPGLQSRGWARPGSYVGSILRRPLCPSCEDPGAPRPAGTELSGSSPHLHVVSDPARAGEEGICVGALGPGPLAGRGGSGNPIEEVGHFLLPGPLGGFVARGTGTPPLPPPSAGPKR